MKNKQASIIFWETANEYIHQYLPNIREASTHTISSYRTGINQFIDYLEQQKKCNRKQISYFDFNRDNIKSYLDWMLNEKRMATRTCNLRLTAIHSLIEFASAEDDQVLPVYLISRTIKGLKVESNPIEYFEKKQMRALLTAPNVSKKTERRNQMLLILMYDTGTRVQEVLDLQLSSLHLKSEIPYITIFGKGRKYRKVPIMRKTMDHLERYLREFHSEDCSLDEPLFYAIAYGQKHFLSPDTLEKMIKRYCIICEVAMVEMPCKPHCHMIRKTRAMDLYQSGVPLTHIQQLLGHENITTTSGFYAFATLETLAKAINKYTDVPIEKKWADKKTLAQIYRV